MLRGAGLAVMIGLTLSACTGSTPEPEVTTGSSSGPTPAVSASASPAPSVPAKPKRPEAMKCDDAEGAAAAAEYFIELYPYVMATGDTEEFEAMSHRACGFCAQALDDAVRIRNLGQVFQGGATDVVVLDQYVRDSLTGIYPLDVEVTQEASKTVGVDRSVVATADAHTSQHRVEMGRKNDRWLVVAIAPRPGA
jgi:hypothetical protein